MMCELRYCQENSCVFFFNDTATTEIYTLSLHDALPISPGETSESPMSAAAATASSMTTVGTNCATPSQLASADRKSTRLNSSHANISYAVFCLKKKQDSTSHLPLLQLFLCRLSIHHDNT